MINQLAGGFGPIASKFIIANRDDKGNITFEFLNCSPNPETHDRMVELFTNLFDIFNQPIAPFSVDLDPELCGGLTFAKRADA